MIDNVKYWNIFIPAQVHTVDIEYQLRWIISLPETLRFGQFVHNTVKKTTFTQIQLQDTRRNNNKAEA
uniref:Uncharacterized protein n=1 Tax=Caenorhabditis brenneri TaxID=135651 RepID=B6VBS4_CAEBE|nr:hypothetical protein Cbre_JD22.005 [Caenorhabditis brenneri]